LSCINDRPQQHNYTNHPKTKSGEINRKQIKETFNHEYSRHGEVKLELVEEAKADEVDEKDEFDVEDE
jgi:hypothetical protein